jgi:hypothetical protein
MASVLNHIQFVGILREEFSLRNSCESRERNFFLWVVQCLSIGCQHGFSVQSAGLSQQSLGLSQFVIDPTVARLSTTCLAIVIDHVGEYGGADLWDKKVAFA